jgi:hypothetical protein
MIDNSKHISSSSSWQAYFRSTQFSVWMLLVVIASLAVRTAAYNYDLSQSAKNNAYNLNPLYKPVKQQPIKTKKPRALANITLPMTQSHNDIRTNAPEAKDSVLCSFNGFLQPNTNLSVQESTLRLTILNAPSSDFCALHAVFRI